MPDNAMQPGFDRKLSSLGRAHAERRAALKAPANSAGAMRELPARQK
jgi:hypothetical protein